MTVVEMCVLFQAMLEHCQICNVHSSLHSKAGCIPGVSDTMDVVMTAANAAAGLVGSLIPDLSLDFSTPSMVLWQKLFDFELPAGASCIREHSSDVHIMVQRNSLEELPWYKK